jgi:hypothetical protein
MTKSNGIEGRTSITLMMWMTLMRKTTQEVGAILEQIIRGVEC